MYSKLDKKTTTQTQVKKSATPQLKNNPFLKENAQPQVNPFLSNTEVTQQKAVVQMVKEKGKRVKGGGKKKGLFIGDGGACHIHIVGDNDHFKVGNGKRINLQKSGNGAYFLNSINNCIQSIQEYAGMKGYDQCLNWLTAQRANAV
jgi:hypothetical protein